MSYMWRKFATTTNMITPGCPTKRGRGLSETDETGWRILSGVHDQDNLMEDNEKGTDTSTFGI